MASPSAVALKLGGFLLAHAFWIIAELEEGELYVPQALCENAEGGRQLFVFEAPTQGEGIARGKQFLAESSGEFERCAFARDGLIRTEDGALDVLTVDIVEGPLPPKLTVIQPYGRSKGGEFQLFGDELMLTEAEPVSPAQSSELSERLRSGAADHQGAEGVWRRIDAGRSLVNPLS